MKKVIGIDLGGTDIKAGLIDNSGKIIREESIPTEAHKDRGAIFSNIVRVIKRIFDDDCSGIGIGAPGCIDTTKGIIVGNIQNIPALNGFHMKQELEREFNTTVLIDNDATVAVKGEYLFGAGKGYKDILCITLGTGVGGGLILNGDVYHGTSDFAGEIGHMVIVPNGRPCTCGNNGCFEQYASASALIRQAKKFVSREVPSGLLDYPPDEISAKIVCDLARDGDAVCQMVLWEAARFIGLAIANCANLLNLDLAIIGGGVSAAGKVLLDPVRVFTQKYTIPFIHDHLHVELAHHRNSAGIMGAAAMVFLEQHRHK